MHTGENQSYMSKNCEMDGILERKRNKVKKSEYLKMKNQLEEEGKDI